MVKYMPFFILQIHFKILGRNCFDVLYHLNCFLCYFKCLMHFFFFSVPGLLQNPHIGKHTYICSVRKYMITHITHPLCVYTCVQTSIWCTHQSVLHYLEHWRLIVGCNRLLLSFPVKCLPCSVTHLPMHSWKNISAVRKRHWFQWDQHFAKTL